MASSKVHRLLLALDRGLRFQGDVRSLGLQDAACAAERAGLVRRTRNAWELTEAGLARLNALDRTFG